MIRSTCGFASSFQTYAVISAWRQFKNQEAAGIPTRTIVVKTMRNGRIRRISWSQPSEPVNDRARELDLLAVSRADRHPFGGGAIHARDKQQVGRDTRLRADGHDRGSRVPRMERHHGVRTGGAGVEP